MASSLADAARRLTQPDVTPAELAEIAAAHSDLRLAVAVHPNVYPELRAWIAHVTPPAPTPVAPVPPPVVENREPATQGMSAPGRGARLPWIVAAVAVVVALASVGALVLRPPGGSAAGDERGFASPEDAVAYFTERLAAGDVGGASEAFAVETLVDGFSYQAFVERTRAVTAQTWLPVSSDGYRTIDEGLRRGEVASQLRSFVQRVVAPARDFTFATTLADGDLTPADLEDELAPAGLADLSVLRVDELNRAGDRYSEAFKAQADPYGADELRDVAILYDTASGPALGGMQLLRYGDRWHVWGLTSALLGTGLGGLERASEQDYEDAVAELQG